MFAEQQSAPAFDLQAVYSAHPSLARQLVSKSSFIILVTRMHFLVHLCGNSWLYDSRIEAALHLENIYFGSTSAVTW